MSELDGELTSASDAKTGLESKVASLESPGTYMYVVALRNGPLLGHCYCLTGPYLLFICPARSGRTKRNSGSIIG